jgi:hypothetical protein
VRVSRPFRRHFHRPSEIVIGYDEQVLAAGTLREVREAWGGTASVRTMPFNRAEPDPTSALMLTLGEVGEGGIRRPSQTACERIASALAAATPAPWRFGIRFDLDDVIVRANVEASTAPSLVASLLALPELETASLAAAQRWRHEGLHLITASWDDRARDRWMLVAAHGFKGDKWMRTLDGAAE